MAKTIAKDNLPNIKILVDSFSLTVQPHTHPISRVTGFSDNTNEAHNSAVGMGYIRGKSVNDVNTKAGGSNTNSVSPQTNALGSGQALDITPSYYTTHMWLRTS